MTSPHAPRVLVGCPTYSGKEYCLARYAERVKSLDYPSYDILLVDNSDDGGRYRARVESLGLPCVKGPKRRASDATIAASREILRRRAVAGGYDYFFNLEQDVIPPADILRRLVAHGKEVVGGWYHVTVGIEGAAGGLTHYLKEPCLSLRPPRRDTRGAAREARLLQEGLLRSGLLKVCVGSFGACLMSRRVLKAVTFRPDASHRWYDGTMFYLELRAMKQPVFVDPDLLLPHFQTYGAASPR